MKFDASVNLGHVLTIVALFAGGAIAFTDIKVELAELSIKVDHFNDRIEDLEQRMKSLEDAYRKIKQ